MNKLENSYDIIVIGGGPAGMIAAGRAAELGAKVLLLEQNDSLGHKLLLTGGGRCNLMNYEPDTRRFLERFKDRQKFLFSPFSQFGVSETLAFFNSLGLETKIEAEGRVFPVSDSAVSVLETMLSYLKKTGVTVQTGARVTQLTKRAKKITGLIVVIKDQSRTLLAKKIILATGGLSRPDTGATGDGLNWLRILGHDIPLSSPALVPVKIKENWVKELSGLSLADVKLKVLKDNKKVAANSGKLLFTHFGLSGPLVLNMSRTIGELLKTGAIQLALDFRPDLDYPDLDRDFRAYLADKKNRLLKNCLTGFVPATLAPVLIRLANIDGKKPVNLLKKSERLSIVKLLKDFRLTATGLLGLDKAIITRGGANLAEIDLKTMRSRLYPNLFIIGDLLDIDRPSGGYSLQLCWTSGYVAGTWAAVTKA